MEYKFRGFGDKASMRDSFMENVHYMMQNDDDMIILDTDLGSSIKTEDLAKRFGRYTADNNKGRVVSCGISEQLMMAGAGGLAAEGYEVWASTFAMFAQRGGEPFLQGVAIPDYNVKLWLSHYGLGVGKDGSTAQSMSDLGFWRSVPNVRGIITPADAEEALQAAQYMHENEGIYIARLTRNSVPSIFDKEYRLNGEGVILLDESGSKDRRVTFISNGEMTHQALLASIPDNGQKYETLLEKGYGVRVVHMPFFPVNRKILLEASENFDYIVTVEDHSIDGGLGDAVGSAMAEQGFIEARLCKVGLTSFAESGEPQDLYEKYGLSGKRLATSIPSLFV
ncbi:MAG: transketolase C-terminal domain-containing protein [Candidatus Aenigmatarchaeota archaeon]|nr:hypothetical protein [Nanoarchaeota archaeon]